MCFVAVGTGLETCGSYANEAWRMLRNTGLARVKDYSEDEITPDLDLCIPPDKVIEALNVLGAKHRITICAYTFAASTNQYGVMHAVAVIPSKKRGESDAQPAASCSVDDLL